MIQYYLDIERQLQAIAEKQISYGQIQKIYSTAYFISLAIRSPGKTYHLYLGRGNGFEGVWLHDSAPPSILRRKDNFLEYFRRHLSACSFIELKLDTQDRIVQLDYQKFGERHSLSLFWKARKLYFLHRYQEQPGGAYKLLLSWRGKAFTPLETDEALFPYFDEVGRSKDMDHKLVSQNPTSIEELLAQETGTASLKGLSSSPTFLQRKKDNIEDDLRKARQWEKLQSILDQQQSLDVYELKVGDQKIKFESELNPFERRNLLFQKIKKLKRGESILTERLGAVTEQLQGKETATKAASTIPINKPVWGKDEKILSQAQVKSKEDEFRVYRIEGASVAVGLSAQGNDQMRSKWAGREDFWVHLDGIKSAHAIVKMQNSHAPTPEQLDFAASLVAHYSDFKDEWIPLIYTQVKYLKGVAGSAGMVTYKKEKHLRCRQSDIANILEG